jgi:CHAT domain-containing protein/Flp pilus assembly protein TadD
MRVKAAVMGTRVATVLLTATLLLLPGVVVAVIQERDTAEEAQRLNVQVAALYKQGRYKEAIQPAERALRISKNTVGEAHPLYATSLNNLAALYYSTSRNTESERLYLEALNVRRKALGVDHSDYATSLSNLATLYHSTGRYTEAEPLYLEALEVRRKAPGVNHLDYASSLYNLATLYYNMGRNMEAERLHLEALEVRRKAPGEAHPSYASSLNNLAALYYNMGRYTEAESLYIEARELRRKALGEAHPDYATSLNNLAALYHSIGRNVEAERLYLEAREVRRKVLGVDHPDYASSLNNLAALYYNMGRYAEGERLLVEVRDVLRKAPGEEHPDYAKSLNDLAAMYLSTGRYTEAERLYLEAREVWRKTLGEAHPRFATTLSNIGALYYSTGRYTEAERFHLAALEVRRKALGETHLDYASSLNSLAHLCVATGRPREALSYLSRSMAVEQANLRRIFASSSEATMRQYLATVSSKLDVIISLTWTEWRSNPIAVGEALTWALRRKGMVLDTLVRFRQEQLLAASDPAVAAKATRLRYLRNHLSNLSLSPPVGMSPETLRQELSQARAEAEHIEAKLNRALSSKNQDQVEEEVNLEAIRRRLAPGTALVEFIRSDVFNSKAIGTSLRRLPARYFAFILTSDSQQQPRMIDLGEAARVEKAVHKLREHVAATKDFLKGTDERQVREAEQAREDSYRLLVKELYDLAFAPVRSELGGAKTVYLATDGQLSLVPFEALVADSGEGAKYLVEEYGFAYLTSGRDLLRAANQSGRGAVVFADPDYDLAAEKRAAELKKLAASAPAPSKPTIGSSVGAAPTPLDGVAPGKEIIYRGELSRDVRGGGSRWPRLDNSAAEGADVARSLGAMSYGSVAEYFGGSASEEALKRVRSPRVLHLSTHGFFLPDLPEQVPDEGVNAFDFPISQSNGGSVALGLARLGASGAESPLLRSGLVLAGANLLGEQIPPSQQLAQMDDGWVTAEEAALLDLSGTELVVLSACATGLGMVAAGEGVYGLRRALRLAGAGTAVVTLFEVPDRESSLLMHDFYEGLKGGKGKLGALREAQLRLIKERRAAGGAAHPFFWAGFILSGDPN